MRCIVMACIVFWNVCSFAEESIITKEEEAMQDAVILVRWFMSQYNDVPLFSLSIFADNEAQESCQITQPVLESLIRQHAFVYDGGTKHVHLTRTLHRMRVAFGTYADAMHDNDGIVTQKEMRSMMRDARKNNGMKLLLCLFDAYLKK